MTFPKEVAVSLGDLDKCLKSVENDLKPILDEDSDEQYKKLSSLDKARHDITALYALNSLFWVYLRTCGEEPQQSEIKTELGRVRAVMTRLQEVIDRQSAMKVDRAAAGRMISKSLWQPGEKHGHLAAPSTGSAVQNDAPTKRRKKI